MHCWEEEYAASKKRLMVIGQETNGWWDCPLRNDADVAEAIEYYEWFELGNSQGHPYGGPFWNRVRRINGKLNGKGVVDNFLWTNINKFGKKGSGRPDSRVTDLENTNFNVFQRELEIVKPDVCVFFTGPYYDSDIRGKLPDAEFEEFIEGEDKTRIARVKSQYLPASSYRTYHPRAGNMSKDWWGPGRYEDVLNKIVEDALNQ